MSHLSMTCSPVEEHHLSGASSTGAASLEDFMAVMCLEIKMGKYEILIDSLHTSFILKTLQWLYPFGVQVHLIYELSETSSVLYRST